MAHTMQQSKRTIRIVSYLDHDRLPLLYDGHRWTRHEQISVFAVDPFNELANFEAMKRGDALAIPSCRHFKLSGWPDNLELNFTAQTFTAATRRRGRYLFEFIDVTDVTMYIDDPSGHTPWRIETTYGSAQPSGPLDYLHVQHNGPLDQHPILQALANEGNYDHLGKTADEIASALADELTPQQFK